MDVWRFFEDPRLLHAAAVHFPIALGVLGVPLAIVAALTKMKFGLRQTVLAVYLLVALAAFAATTTGTAIQTKALPPGAADSLAFHSAIANYVWIAAMVTAALFLLTAVKSEWFRAMFAVLGVLAATTTAALIMLTAVRGQALVYEHGIGPKPKPLTAAPAAARPVPQIEAPVAAGPSPDSGTAPASDELESLEPAPAAQTKSAEEMLNAWRAKAKVSKPGEAEGREPTRYERFARWFRRYWWPY